MKAPLSILGRQAPLKSGQIFRSMHPYSFAWATAAVPLFVPLAQAAQSVPPTAIDPPYNHFESRQEQDLLRDLPDHQYDPPKTHPWPVGIVPSVCHAYPKNSDNSLDMSRLEVRDVYYNDCEKPWTICRYADSRISWDEAMMVLGKIPVGMRQYVAQVILAPESYAKQRVGIGAETWGASTAFLSEMNLGVAVHEFSHILDLVVGSGPNATEQHMLSNSSSWIEFYNNDTKVPTDYAATAANDSLVKQQKISLVEDFADAGRWAMSNMVRVRTYRSQNQNRNQSLLLSRRGGRRNLFFRNSSSTTTTTATMVANQLAVYSADWEACGNQIDGYRTLLEDIIFPPGGKCTGKTLTSDAVVAATGQRSSYNHTRDGMGMGMGMGMGTGAGRLKLRAVGVPAIVPADWVMRVRFPPYMQVPSG
ncbi:conidiation-specific protein (con-13) protein [Apiospora sp. TS-2023a]